MAKKVSLICTVLNEGDSIKTLLASIAAQTRLPDEVVIVDGGSRDNTVAAIESYQDRLPLRVIVAPGANISQGRNMAIEAARGPVIASTDAGVRLDPAWLEKLMAPLEWPSSPAVVAGFFVPDPHTTFEVAMGATVLPQATDIEPATFLPSSRSVAFLKSAWEAAGRYPEWLDFCEDIIFDLRLRDETGPFVFVPEAVAYFRPRSSLPVFFKQYYQYARGDGKADLWRKRHAIRYLTYLVGLPLLIVLGKSHSRWWWLLGLGLGFRGLFYTPYRRLWAAWTGLPLPEKLLAAWWVPVIRLTGDVAKMIGYPVGWWWRVGRLPAQPELNWQRRRG